MTKDQSATLCLLHIVYGRSRSASTKRCMSLLDTSMSSLLLCAKRARRFFARAEKQVKKRAIKYQTVLCATAAHAIADAITEQSKKCGADLIVLATHGPRRRTTGDRQRSSEQGFPHSRTAPTSGIG